MRIRILDKSAGKVGTEKTVDGPSGRVLILLGKAEKVEQVLPAPKTAPAPKKVKAKRTYQRSDLVAEPPAFERPPFDIPPTTFADPETADDSDAP